ncbi:MAG: endonuclease/exonuclease/phosphatase family protein [Methanococcaceae archaeon]
MGKLFSKYLFVAVLLLLATGKHEYAADNPIRIMTYNIRYAASEKEHGINAWEFRKDAVANMIRFNKADIVGLQEALKVQLDDFKNLLPEYAYVGVGRDDGKDAGEHAAILYKKSRFTVVKSSTFWLSETPAKVSMGWDAVCNRVVTWAQFRDKMTGKCYFHFNTHFDHIGEKARINSASLLLVEIKAIAGNSPVVVSGDFNFTSDTQYYKILTTSEDEGGKLKITDAQKISVFPHYGGHVSFNDFDKNTNPENKIDYIFIKNGIKVKSHGIIGEKFEGRYPSDHMPVISDIDIIK